MPDVLTDLSPECQLIVWVCIAYGHEGPLLIGDKETIQEKHLYGSMLEME